MNLAFIIISFLAAFAVFIGTRITEASRLDAIGMRIEVLVWLITGVVLIISRIDGYHLDGVIELLGIGFGFARFITAASRVLGHPKDQYHNYNSPK